MAFNDGSDEIDDGVRETPEILTEFHLSWKHAYQKALAELLDVYHVARTVDAHRRANDAHEAMADLGYINTEITSICNGGAEIEPDEWECNPTSTSDETLPTPTSNHAPFPALNTDNSLGQNVQIAAPISLDQNPGGRRGRPLPPGATPSSVYRAFVLQAFRELAKDEYVPYSLVCGRARQLMGEAGALTSVDQQIVRSKKTPRWRTQMGTIRAQLLQEGVIVKDDRGLFRLSDRTRGRE